MTPTTKKQLTASLEGVRHILSRAGLMGGREVSTAQDYERRINRLLAPEDASALIADANAFVAVNLPYIDKARASAQRAEAEREAAGAPRKAVTDAHHAKQAAAAQARIEMQMRATARDAVDEIL